MNSNAPLVFDSVAALGRMENDREFLAELVDIFAADFPAALVQLQGAWKEGNGRVLAERAHSLKSALGNLGAMQAVEVARSLEVLGNSESAEGVAELIQKFHEAVEAFLVAARNFIEPS